MRIAYSRFLVGLVAEVERAAVRVAAADPDRLSAAVAESRRVSSRLSARLDGSPLTDVVADEIDAGRVVASQPAGASRVAGQEPGWARALRLDAAASQDIAALEYANLLVCFDAETVAAQSVLDEPLAALAMLHELLCAGLVSPGSAAAPRRTARAVHDGAQGRVLYNAPAPESLPERMSELAAWVRDGSGGLPAVLVAGAVHERILEWQPFEAANGRLARVAARVILRAGGLDPHGVGVAERLLAADPLGYHGEVAATIRRRGELGPWLERYAESVAAGLETAADRISRQPRPPAPQRAEALWRQLADSGPVTVAEYAAGASIGRSAAARDLARLAAAGVAEREPGSGGLRYRARSEG